MDLKKYATDCAFFTILLHHDTFYIKFVY